MSKGRIGGSRIRAFLGVGAVVLAVNPGGVARASASAHVSVDLGSALVNGHPVLGRTVAGVTASFGHPSWRRMSGRVYRIGYGDNANFRMMVLFRKQGGVYRAATVAFERAPVFERRIGVNVLAVPPAEFAREVSASYPTWHTERAPLCKSGTCTVVLGDTSTNLHVTFGQTAALGGFLSLWTA